MKDLFGEAPIQPPPSGQRGPKGGKHYTRPNGYASMPGTGPAGETCGSCKYACRQRNYSGNKYWIKCELRRALWTSGRGSDILAGSPACEKWQQVPQSSAHDAEQRK